MVAAQSRVRWTAVLAIVAWSGAANADATADRQALLDYMQHCEGCHQADGSGVPGVVPALGREVGKFLGVPEGREYLVRVPGTAQSLLDDEAVARLINWMLVRFDSEHLPAGFRPYSPSEVGRLRGDPLSRASVERARLTGLFPRVPVSSTGPAGPDSFALCAACHPTSPDGAHGMGPNLRGLIGREAGSAPGFAYSTALRKARIRWSRETLLAFLANPTATVPNTTMTFAGLSDAAEREAVLRFLETLR